MRDLEIKVQAIINCYNDAEFLSACLRSIADHVDRIVVADGAYQLYFEEFKKYNALAQPWSTDGSLEIIQGLHGLPETVLLRCEKPWASQTVKRSKLLDMVPEGDWFLIIDTDEMLIGDVDEGFDEIMESGCLAGRIPLCNLGADVDRLHYFWHPRFFRKEKNMHYEGTHWQLRDYANRIIEADYPVWWTQAFVMLHLKLLKPPDRILPHEAYMTQLHDRGWFEPWGVQQ